MKDMKFPVIRESHQNQKTLSMDEYLQFVQFNLKYTHDKKTYAKWKKMLAVNVPFFIG